MVVLLLHNVFCAAVAGRAAGSSLAVQTTLQPWSASIYHSILQQGLQPSLTFTKVPKTLFDLKSREAAMLGGPKPASYEQQGNLVTNQADNSSSLQHFSDLADCTVSFEEARVAVAADLLTLGYISKSDRQLYLNPQESSRLSPGDLLVALTTHDKVANSGVV